MNYFLQLAGKTFLLTGLANKKSLAYHVAKSLQQFEAKLILAVQTQESAEKLSSHFPGETFIVCDCQRSEDLENLRIHLQSNKVIIDGFLHSIAFADFSGGVKPFHETPLNAFQQAMQISAFSLVQYAEVIRHFLHQKASVVTVGISDVKATCYGYMGPIKAMLESMIPYLAESFSKFSQVRFNCVASGPLKTSAAAGIPGYLENYLFAEQLTLRQKALSTEEVSNTILFLLSSASSGINGSTIVVDAGISGNHFAKHLVEKSLLRENSQTL